MSTHTHHGDDCGGGHHEQPPKALPSSSQSADLQSSDEVKAEGCPSNTEDAGRAKMCEGCPGRELCQSQSNTDPDQDALDVRMKAIAHKIFVLSGKGGVGKSSLAAQLAVAFSTSGKKVGLLDVDICGPSIPKLMGLENGQQVVNMPYGWLPIKSKPHNIAVMSVGFLLQDADNAVVWRGPRKTGLIKRFLKDTFWGKLDYLVVDTPPGTSDEHLSIVNALKRVQPDGVVIITSPQEVALDTIRKELSFCKKMKLKVLGIVENMSGFACPCCGEVTEIFSNGGGEKLAVEYGVPFLGRIPLDPEMAARGDQGQTLPENTPAAAALATIAQSILNTLG